jgi:transcription antitermination factor nusB
MRKFARESAFQMVYEYLFWGQPNALTREYLIERNKLNEDDIDYLDQVYQGVTEHLDELKRKIEEASINYTSVRLFKCDLAILLLGLYEIEYREDVPDRVALNEAIEISKIYSTDKSGAFINGILAKFIK